MAQTPSRQFTGSQPSSPKTPFPAAPQRIAPFRERAPRYRTSLPAVVDGKLFTITTSVSEQGCALRWSGRPPFERQAIRLRIGAGPLTATLIGVVRWVKVVGSSTLAGVRLSSPPGQERSWLTQIAEVRRSGASEH